MTTEFDPNKVYNAEENVEFEPYKESFTDDIFTFKFYCKCCMVISFLLLGYSFLGDIAFKLRHAFPKAALTTNKIIDIHSVPIQNHIHKNAPILEKGRNEYREFTYNKVANYSISGKIVAINTNFWLRGLMRDDFDEIALMDIGIAYGDISDEKFIKKYLKFKSRKTATGRALFGKYSCNAPNCIPYDYVNSHWSHTHLVPANGNIMGALMKLKVYNDVKLDGYLIDVYHDNNTVSMTSISRHDNNATSRGAIIGYSLPNKYSGGACEIMLVTQVQYKGRIYR